MKRKKSHPKPKPKQYVPNDKYFYLAKEKGYRARSAFKLLEIQARYSILKKGQTVLDVGGYPGSFSQIALEYVGEKGKVVAFDLQEIMPFPVENFWSFQADVFDQEGVKAHIESLEIFQFDTIISDLAPKTSGIRDIDQYRSVELNIALLNEVQYLLKPQGNAVFKLFLGEDASDFLHAAQAVFHRIQVFKPNACRDRSFETYVIGIGKRS